MATETTPKTRRRIGRALVVGACLLGLSAPLVSQTVPPLAMLKQLQVLSLRVDALQARVDHTQYGAEQWSFADVNGVHAYKFEGDNALYVIGWAFSCGYENARVVIVVDDIETTGTPYRYARPDVTHHYTDYCVVTDRPGLITIVDLEIFGDGWNSDGKHIVKIRIYDPFGRMAESRAVPFSSR